MIVSDDAGTHGKEAIAHRRPEDGATHALREHLTTTAERATETQQTGSRFDR